MNWKYRRIGALLVSLQLIAGCSAGLPLDKGTAEAATVSDQAEINLSEIILQNNYSFIDLRSDEAYNGWSIHSDLPKGHVRDAIHFPAEWLTDYTNDLEALLLEAGIDTSKTLILYGDDDTVADLAAASFKNLGCQEVVFFQTSELSNHESVTFEHMENYHMFVYPEWVDDLVKGQTPEHYNQNDYIIIDTNYHSLDAYKNAHLPGAVYMDTCEIEEAPLWNLVSPDQFETLFQNMGINEDTLVILTSDEPMASGRVAAAFLYAGVKDVRILNGGNQAWESKGYAFEEGMNNWVSGAGFKTTIPVHPEYNISIEDAKAILNDPNGRLVAVVSWDEYTGKNNGGYSYFEEKGRIPGSVFGYGGSDGYHSEDWLDEDMTMRSYTEIEDLWQEWDIQPHNKSSFFCATGWRGGLAFFQARAMGWDNVSVYDGGFYEWSRNPNNPLATGDPRDDYKKDAASSELHFLRSVGGQ